MAPKIILSFKAVALLIQLSFFLVSQQGIAQNTNSASLEKSYETSLKEKDQNKALQYSFQLAEIYLKQSNYEKANTWYTLNLKHAIALKNWEAQYKAHEGIGVTTYNLSQFGKAVDAFEKSVSSAQSAKNKMAEMHGLMNVAKAEKANNRVKRSIAPLDKALQLALDLKREESQLLIYKNLWENYEQIGNTSQSKIYKNLYDQLMRTRSQAQKNEQKLNELNQQVDKAQQQADKAQQQASKAQSEKMLTESLLHEKEESLKQVEDSLEEAAAINRERQMQIDLLSKDK